MLHALAVEWDDDIAYRIWIATILEYFWTEIQEQNMEASNFRLIWDGKSSQGYYFVFGRRWPTGWTGGQEIVRSGGLTGRRKPCQSGKGLSW